MRKPSQFLSDYFKDDILKDFFQTVGNQRTRAEYFSYICILCDYAEKDFLELDSTDVSRFFQYMYTRYHNGTLARKTMNVRLSCYNSVARFIYDNYPSLDYINPFRNQQRFTVSDDVATCNVPSLAEMDKIMSAAHNDEMYYLILALAGRAALTATAIKSIRIGNIVETDSGTLGIIFPAKDDFHEPDIAVLPTDVSQLLRVYLSHYEYEDERSYLFYNKYKNPLSLRNIDKAVKKYVLKSGVSPEYTLKDIRSRAIVELSRANVPDSVIADYTGLTQKRVSAFKRAVHMSDTCPADLVNYRLNVAE